MKSRRNHLKTRFQALFGSPRTPYELAPPLGGRGLDPPSTMRHPLGGGSGPPLDNASPLGGEEGGGELMCAPPTQHTQYALLCLTSQECIGFMCLNDNALLAWLSVPPKYSRLAGAHGKVAGSNQGLRLSHMGVHEPCRPGQCMRILQPAEQRRAFQLQLQTSLQVMLPSS